jgi:hypothetical protein
MIRAASSEQSSFNSLDYSSAASIYSVRAICCSSQDATLLESMPTRPATSPPTGEAPRLPKFPRVHQYASDIYNKSMVYRDNSPFLSILQENPAAIFLRPMQLGKTSLFTLAELVFSKGKQAPDVLEYDWLVSEQTLNSSYVLRVDFGGVQADMYGDDWKKGCASFDKSVRQVVHDAVENLMRKHHIGELTNDTDAPLKAGDLVRQLVARIAKSNIAEINSKPAKLLVLVDEYDKPVREVLLDLMCTLGDVAHSDLLKSLKDSYRNYIGFFDNCKVAYGNLEIDMKVWVTGITPIGLGILSSFSPEDLTFDSAMADAVGFLDVDITRMMDVVEKSKPFANNEKALFSAAIKKHFNSIKYGSGSDLYHTRMVNDVMRGVLLKDEARQLWLADLAQIPSLIKVEPPPASVFSVVKKARNLRAVVNLLASGRAVTGFKFNAGMDLSHLVTETIHPDDYLTLLVYLGMAKMEETKEGVVFWSTSLVYRKAHLKPLVGVLKVSIESLMKLQTLEQIYANGVDQLKEFVSVLSEKNMSKLIAWAETEENNNILELQFQAYMAAELGYTLDQTASTTQAKRPPKSSKRKDITIVGEFSVVILELKKHNGLDPPTKAELVRYHNQLQGYVESHRKDAKGLVVAGFVVVMYAKGRQYVVESLCNDNG